MHGSIHLFERIPQPENPVPVAFPAERKLARSSNAPLVGVIRNPRSQRNKGRASELADQPNVLIETPHKRADVTSVLARFAQAGIDYLVVDGGDGTVRDVLTAGAPVFGDSWPELIVLPKGKTNALAVDLGLPSDWNLPRALEAAQAGNTLVRRPLVVTEPAREGAQVTGFILGAGMFSTATNAGQDAHRFGAFDSLAVAVTGAWGVLQAVFGSAGNPWRRPARMRLYDAQGAELPHSGTGPDDQRYLLFASTIERFPVGMKPFGPLASGLRLALVDTPRRSILARLPALMGGMELRRMKERGMHRLALDSFSLEIEDRFILDGEFFAGGNYRVGQGPKLRFVIP